MIGGFDRILGGETSEYEIDRILRLVGVFWPRCVVESGEGSRVAEGSDAAARGWSIPCEIFIYESRDAFASWTAHGLTDDNAAKMVAITVEPDAMSFVVNAEESETARLVSVVIEAVRELRKERHAVPAARAVLRSTARKWYVPEPPEWTQFT